MITKEIAVERYLFTCTKCDAAWTTDYDVQHVEDGHGHQHDYFAMNGLPCIAPTTATAPSCPNCHHGRINVRLAARRATPAADVVDHSPSTVATQPSARLTTEREQAPPLPAENAP